MLPCAISLIVTTNINVIRRVKKILFNRFLIAKFKILVLPVFFIITSIQAWRVFISLTSFLALIAFLLIGYLIGYHVYLSELQVFNKILKIKFYFFFNFKEIYNMSTYEHSLKLRNQETASNESTSNNNNNSNRKTKSILRSKNIKNTRDLPPLEKNESNTADLEIDYLNSFRLNQKPKHSINEINYFENSKKSNKIGDFRSQLEISDELSLSKRTSAMHQHQFEQINETAAATKNLFLATSALAVNANGLNSVSRIPCNLNADARVEEKYLELENETVSTSRLDSSPDTELAPSPSLNNQFREKLNEQINLPIFLPIASNVGDNEDSTLRHSRRSSRRLRSKIIKLPIGYYDSSSPELSSRLSKETNSSKNYEKKFSSIDKNRRSDSIKDSSNYADESESYSKRKQKRLERAVVKF